VSIQDRDVRPGGPPTLALRACPSPQNDLGGGTRARFARGCTGLRTARRVAGTVVRVCSPRRRTFRRSSGRFQPAGFAEIPIQLASRPAFALRRDDGAGVREGGLWAVVAAISIAWMMVGRPHAAGVRA